MTRAALLMVLLLAQGCRRNAAPVDVNRLRPHVQQCAQRYREELPEPGDIPAAILKTLGIPSDDQAAVLEAYGNYRTLQRLVRPALRAAASDLSLDISLRDPEFARALPDSVKEAASSDPLFMAYAIAVGPGLDPGALNAAYVDMVVRSFRVPEQHVRKGLWMLLARDSDSILQGVVDLMGRKAPDVRGYAVNSLLPFMTFVTARLELDDSTEKRVLDGFGTFLGDRAALATLVQKMRSHLDGEALENRHLLKVNALLRKNQLYLMSYPGYSALSEVLPYSLTVGSRDVGSVLALRRLGVSLLPSVAGLSEYNDKDVILVVDILQRENDAARDLLDHGVMPLQFTADSERLWDYLDLPLDRPKAEAVVRALMQRAWAGVAEPTMLADAFHDVAIHELKHKYDSSRTVAEKWIALDSEVDAYTTQMVLGRRPSAALFSAINQMQAFRLGGGPRDATERADALLVEFWNLAMRVKAGTLDDDGLRKAARTMHEAHRTVRLHKPFGPLEAFEKDVVRSHVETAPPFRL